MSAQNHIIDSTGIKGIWVRAFDDERRMNIASIYQGCNSGKQSTHPNPRYGVAVAASRVSIWFLTTIENHVR